MVTRGSSSHIWCERCHKRRIHSTHRYRMCRSCASLHIHELKEERRRIKDTRALRRADDMPAEEKPQHITVAQAVHEYIVDRRADDAVDAFLHNPTKLEHSMDALARVIDQEPVEPVRSQTTQQVYDTFDRVAKRMPEDVRLEIGLHYGNHEITLDEIRREYGVGLGVIMAIVKDLGLTKRSETPDFKRRGKRAQPGYFSMVDGKRIWMSGRKPTPAQRAYEKGLRDAARERPAKALPPRIEQTFETVHNGEPIAASAPVERVSSLPVWRVAIETIVEVECERIEDVIVQTRISYPGAVIRSINPAGR